MNRFKENKVFMGLYEKALPDNMDLQQKLLMVRKAGYSYMEISIDASKGRLERLKWDKIKINKLKVLMEETGVPIISMCLSAHRNYPLGSSHKELRNKGIEIMEDAIWLAFFLGIRIIQVAGYDVLMDELSTEKSKETFLNNLRNSLKIASKLGIILAIENVDIFSADSVSKILYFVNKIKSPWLNLYPDVGNLNAMKQDVLKEIELGKSRIVAIHIKDTVEGIVRRVPYGEGNVDFVSIFKELKKINFHGPLLLEMWAEENKNNYKIISSARKWVFSKIMKTGYS